MNDLNLSNDNMKDEQFVLHHIGIAVNNLKTAIKSYESLNFYQLGQEVLDIDRNIKILFIQNQFNKVELIATLNSQKPSPIARYLKNGNTIYHLCYTVPDIKIKIIKLRKLGFILIKPLQPAIAFNGARIAFMFNKDLGLIELLENMHY